MEGVWRDVGVGDVLRGLSARALVWGYADSESPSESKSEPGRP